jgi:hypothetical protein
MSGAIYNDGTGPKKAASLMGWASFGLAAAMLAIPDRITRTFGFEGKENLIRGFGVQEILAGIGVLGLDAEKAMWGRAGGDVIHIGTLATGLATDDQQVKRNVMVGLAALAGFLVADSLIAAKLRAKHGQQQSELHSYAGGSTSAAAAAAPASTSKAETPAGYRQAPQLATVS